MGKHPKFDPLNSFAEKGKDFTLTGSQYEEFTGAPLPKGKSYLINHSALACWAKKRGYDIAGVQEEAVIERTIYFKKRMG